MALIFNPHAVYPMATGALSILFAVVVFKVRPHDRQNKFLALTALLLGLDLVVRYGLRVSFDDPATQHGLTSAGWVAISCYPIALGLFLSTLNSPWARPFRQPISGSIIFGYLGFVAVLGVLRPTLVTRGLEYVPAANFWDDIAGPLTPFNILNIMLVSLYGIVVAVTAVRRARTPASRRKARYFAAGIVARDVLVVAALIVALRPNLTSSTILGWEIILFLILFTSAALAFVILLTYGILAAQVFDIDVRIRWGISKGTLATVFLAVFLVVALTLENFLTTSLGWAAGSVAAGLLLFALRPLQQAAERLSRAAMPAVTDTLEYRIVRKRHVYMAAVESALVDAIVTPRERDMLATLARELGITVTEARQLERNVTSGSRRPQK